MGSPHSVQDNLKARTSLRLVEQRYMRNCVLRARLITGAYLVLRRSTSANAEQTKTSTFGNCGYRT